MTGGSNRAKGSELNSQPVEHDRSLLAHPLVVNTFLVDEVAEKPKPLPYKEIGQRIADFRLTAGRRRGKRLPQRELAEAIGVSEGTVTAWEIGKQKPDGINLLKLADALDVAPDQIMNAPVHTYGSIPVRARDYVEAAMETLPQPKTRSRRADELTEMLSQKNALRRMAQTISDKDLVKVAYAIAIDDGWTEEEMLQLDAWRKEILGDEADAG